MVPLATRLTLAAACLITLTLLPQVSLANDLEIIVKAPSSNCIEGCYDALALVSYADIKAKKPALADYCNSTTFVQSLALCGDKYCSAIQQEEGWEYIVDECKAKKVKVAAQATILAAIDMSSVQEVDTLSHQKDKTAYNQTILLSKYSWEMGYKTNNVKSQQDIHNHAYGWAVYILLGTAVLIGALNRLFSIYVHRHLRPLESSSSAALESGGALPSQASSKGAGLWSTAYTLYKKHFATPALFGYRHAQPWGWLSIPTRIQGFFIFAYVAINVVFMCSNYTIFQDNLTRYHDETLQLQRYVADRLAIMCFYNMPLLWALAGRNDVILWITGWSYSTANIFHRWVARMVVFQGFVHGVLWAVMKRDDWKDRFLHRMYWTTGIFALICMSFMVVLSVRPLRERSYEVFLIVHIILALASLVLLRFHITHMKGEYEPFVWATVGVWGLDRAIRMCRVAVLTFRAFTRTGKNTVAVMSDEKSGLIRLSITTSIRITPHPGDYYFLYTPLSLRPWENHPFTVASWEQDPSGNSTTLHFLVAPQTGTTKRWRKKVLKRKERTDNVRMLLEGPYGHTNPVEQFERVLMVAGGSGITSMLPYIYKLCHHDESERFDNITTRHVTLVWIVKDTKYAADVLHHELREYINEHSEKAQSGIVFDVEMYVTREENATTTGLINDLAHEGASSSSSSSSGSASISSASGSNTRHGSLSEGEGEKTFNGTPDTPSTAVMDQFTAVTLDGHVKPNDTDADYEKRPAPSRLKITSGRPGMPALLRSKVDTLVGRERLAVSACGPAGMTDDMRRAVCDIYGSPQEDGVQGGTVEYFEELFSW
ncbi:hypothetical protein I317_05048 [Kwoniella heveanensis CBS 569]|nr:hypothetical protein I317_05048 [Kwoniella heveanensis CBS 569]